MAKYLIHGAYTEKAVQGVLKEGGSGRARAVADMLEVAGGRLDSLYFGIDGHTVYGVFDLPDDTTGAALGLAVKAAGVVDVDITKLLTPAEMDVATQKSIQYRPPGA